MDSLIQSINPDLIELASQRNISGVLKNAAYSLGGISFKPENGISYELTLTNTGEAILIQGNIKGRIRTQCARCLELAFFDLDEPVEAYYLLPNAKDVGESERFEFSFIDKSGEFDISPQIYSAVCDATPFVVLCKDSCRGLCPKCGKNLNIQKCSCNDGVDQDNPFAVLKNLNLD